MSTDITVSQQTDNNPFSRMPAPAGANVGAVAIEQERAIAEAQGQLILAKRFPRDLNAAYSELMQSCKLPALAQVAFYTVPRAGGKVSGPSIRLAEEIARVYGNFEFGHRELSRIDGKSEIEVYAWDKQTNNRSIRQITVMHVIDTKDGPRKLRDQKDIDDKIANVASKQLRGRILAMMPKWMVEAATEECKKTLAGTNDEPVPVRVRKMTQAFSKFGVTVKHLEDYLEHGLDDTTLDELVDLTGVFNALKDGGKASDYFGAKNEPATVSTQAQALNESAAPANDNKPHPAASARKKAAPKPEPQPEPAPEPEPQASAESDSDLF